jgi:hypothetical protein
MDAHRAEARPAAADVAAVAGEKPNGPVVAVMLAAGVGALVLGILTTLASASESFATSLQYADRVGPLSGKTLWSVFAFLVAWGGLSMFLRGREIPWRTAIWALAILVGLGILGTFPTFFQEFAPAE